MIKIKQFKNMKNIMGFNYLHNHPIMEKKLNVDNEHVIVDRKDWEDVVDYMYQHLEETQKFLGKLKY